MTDHFIFLPPPCQGESSQPAGRYLCGSPLLCQNTARTSSLEKNTPEAMLRGYLNTLSYMLSAALARTQHNAEHSSCAVWPDDRLYGCRRICHITRFILLSSRLYCRFWNCTKSARRFADYTAGRELRPAPKNLFYYAYYSIAAGIAQAGSVARGRFWWCIAQS